MSAPGRSHALISPRAARGADGIPVNAPNTSLKQQPLRTKLQGWLLLGLLVLGAAASAQTGRNLTSTAPGSARSCPPIAQRPSAEDVQKAQSEARDRGMLWRIQKGGSTSYLYGTLHVGTLAWAPPGPTLQKALAEVDQLALELDISDRDTMAQLQAALANKPGDPPVSAALLRGLAAETAAACLPDKALDGQKPAVRAMSLLLLDARWEGLDAGFAQEAVLADIARANGLPITALEKVDEQMTALLPTTAQEAQRMIQQVLSQLKSGAARRSTKRLAQAWADGRLEELADYERWCECISTEEDRQMLRRMNDDRNPALASRIDRLHSQGRKVFAAVGALHMTGPKALPQLMQQRGYTVERVAYPR
jgi:uncharacterized protein YbaP (TraB family)